MMEMMIVKSVLAEKHSLKRIAERAEIIWEKGTNRSKFFRGEVDKYTWVDIGSSFLPSELTAAFLWAQLEKAEYITERRMAIWRRYHEAFADLEAADLVKRPVVPRESAPNAHSYFLVLSDSEARRAFIERLKADGVNAIFHYVPLHESPAGRKHGRASDSLPVTTLVSECLVRLPLWIGLEEEQARVIESCRNALLTK